MLINRRNALMTGRRLPYDAELEFLESSGTQYVDTGVFVDSATTQEMCLRLKTIATYTGVFGSLNAPNNSYLFIGRSNGVNVWQLGYAGAYANIDAADTNLHTFRYEPTAIYKDQAVVATFAFSGTNSKTQTVFTIHKSDGTVYAGTPMRLYSYRIWKNGTLVRDYIPVRRGAVGYLYDRVSGKLFGNAGTGDFVLGPDVVPVEYIESHGTEYIDTGVAVADPSTIEIGVTSTTPVSHGFTHQNVASGTWVCAYYSQSTNVYYAYYKNYKSRVALYQEPMTQALRVYDGSSGVYRDGVLQQSFTASVGADSIANKSWTMGCVWDFYANKYDFRNSVGSEIYGAYVKTTGALVRSFRPVRVGSGSTWEGAMMDDLTRRIYRNQGTGAFGYGNDLKYGALNPNGGGGGILNA